MLGLCVWLGGCETAAPTDPAPVTGGREFVLDQDAFVSLVSPVLTSKGCDNTACHGGGRRGTFQLSPTDDKNLLFDFEQVSSQVNPLDREASNLLVKPLAPAAGGAEHTASSEQFGFMSTADPDYQALLAWIQDGELR
jgi:hypothetical protein